MTTKRTIVYSNIENTNIANVLFCFQNAPFLYTKIQYGIGTAKGLCEFTIFIYIRVGNWSSCRSYNFYFSGCVKLH